MKRYRFLVWFGIVVMALSVGALALSISRGAIEGGPVPIKFHMKPGGIVQNNVSAHVERANAMLSMVFSQIRENPGSVTPEMMQKQFFGTYLRSPKLHLDDKTVVEGWPAVLDALKVIVNKSGYVTPQGVSVVMEYIPYDVKTKPPPQNDRDFKFTIRTSLGIYPSMDPDLEGTLFHRRICEIDP
jgi:hypothetical protein